MFFLDTTQVVLLVLAALTIVYIIDPKNKRKGSKIDQVKMELLAKLNKKRANPLEKITPSLGTYDDVYQLIMEHAAKRSLARSIPNYRKANEKVYTQHKTIINYAQGGEHNIDFYHVLDGYESMLTTMKKSVLSRQNDFSSVIAAKELAVTFKEFLNIQQDLLQAITKHTKAIDRQYLRDEKEAAEDYKSIVAARNKE